MFNKKNNPYDKSTIIDPINVSKLEFFNRKTQGHIWHIKKNAVDTYTLHTKSNELKSPRPWTKTNTYQIITLRKCIKNTFISTCVSISFYNVLWSLMITQSNIIKVSLCLPTWAIVTCLSTMLHRPILVILTKAIIIGASWTEAGIGWVIRTVICSHWTEK